jgi:hypothetical protein
MQLVARGVLLAAMMWVASPAARAGDDSLELPIKATFLYKFADFITWPAPAAASSNLVLCVIGRDSFGPILDRAVSGQVASGRPIQLRRLAQAEAAGDCHIVFVAASSGTNVRDVLTTLQGRPVLTVTDGAPSPDASGIVNLFVQANRVRFSINVAAARANRLEISSKLMDLAVAPGRR